MRGSLRGLTYILSASLKTVEIRNLFVVLALLIGTDIEPQAAQAAQGSVPPIRDCQQCPPMVAIPALNDKEGFAMARHELTWREYIPSVIEASCPLPIPEKGRDPYGSGLAALADNFPVVGLPPTQIGCYLDWLKRKTGHTYRLPTGAEWSHAARAGAQTVFPWGDEVGFNNAAISLTYAGKRVASSSDPRPWLGSLLEVEQFRPNAWGLYDVVGNVAEYTSDSQPGEPGCIAQKDAAFCRRQEIRGGDVMIVSSRVGVGMMTQPDPIGIPRGVFAGGAQPYGYRLLREY